MNVYSELLELLTPERKDAPAGLFGTLTAVSPLTVTVRGTALTEGLFYLQGTVFREEDIGKELARCPARRAFGSSALWEVGARDLSRLGHAPTPRRRSSAAVREWPVTGRTRALPCAGRAVSGQRRRGH